MRPDRFTNRIRGRLWQLIFTTLQGDADGWCDPDRAVPRSEFVRPQEARTRLPRVIVHDQLEPQQELEITIHEMLHSGLWDIGEEAVAELAEDIARGLWKRGWRPCR